jgi:hypothetical protein
MGYDALTLTDEMVFVKGRIIPRRELPRTHPGGSGGHPDECFPRLCSTERLMNPLETKLWDIF